MRKNSLKKALALVLAVMTLVSCFAIPAFATSQSGTSNAFGNWSCSTYYGNDGYYYTATSCEKPSRIYMESEYQSYPSGSTYATAKFDSNAYDTYYAHMYLLKDRQSTIWSFHSWKSSSGTGMSKYTQLINK